jgi:hypothetical protein
MTAPFSKLEYTFDNPSHPQARWGEIMQSPHPNVVRLAYIGAGGFKEIQGCREKKQ